MTEAGPEKTTQERTQDEGSIVIVAPREIHDLAYRASRIAGCDPGTAERIANNVTFAEICHGAAVRVFCLAVESSDLLASGWVSGPDEVASAEVAARSEGAASAVFEPAVPLAAVAAALDHARQRGAAAVGLDLDVSGDEMLAAVELRAATDGAAAAETEQFGVAVRSAYRRGVLVDAPWFRRLEAAAAPFLVAEATLDALID